MKGLTIKSEEITPKKAAAWLLKNVTNRPLREVTLLGYMADMKAGQWLETHQGIAFNDRDELMDGQHRLTAIVRSEVPHDGRGGPGRGTFDRRSTSAAARL